MHFIAMQKLLLRKMTVNVDNIEDIKDIYDNNNNNMCK